MGGIFSGTKKCRVLVVGLDNSGKSTIINYLKPAKDKVAETQATVGFQVENFRHGTTNFTMFDMSGQGRYRNLWEHYYQDAQAVIFVIDSADTVRMCVVEDELKALLSHKDIALKPIPLLIFANKIDLPDALTAPEMSKLLKLDQVTDRPWTITPSNSLTGEGLQDGIAWLDQKLMVIHGIDCKEPKPAPTPIDLIIEFVIVSGTTELRAEGIQSTLLQSGAADQSCFSLKKTLALNALVLLNYLAIMFPAFENAQQQQQQQSSSFSQTAMNDSKLPAFGQFAPLSGNSMADAFKPASNPFGGFSSNNFAAPNMTTSQTGFGFASSLSTSASSFPGLQTLAFPQFTSPSNPPALSGHDAGREPPESVFAEFVRPAAMKPSEPVPSASAPSRSYCTFFQKGSCRNGESCPFLHEIPPSAHVDGPPKFVFGANSESRSKATANHEARPKAICRYFLAGACLKGESCKFLHDTKSADGHNSVPAETKIESFPPVPSPPMEGLFTRKASPTHPATVTFNASSIHGAAQTVKIVEPVPPASPKEEIDSEAPSDEALITARSRRFRGSSFIPPESSTQTTPIVSLSDELIDEEEPEFASGSACIVGTLMTMCSEEEIRKRDIEMDVHILESVQDDSGNLRSTRRADPGKMVKKYQRSAAGMHAATPSEIRPPVVLAKTVEYLFNHVLDSNLVPPLDVYNFLRDRFRAVRKDFALQDQAETLAATVHEQIARYFILSHHELCEEKEDDFQKFQNLQQVSHTITSLNHYYKDLRLKNGIATPSEAEFYSYQILLNMRDTNKLNDRLMNLPAHIRSSPLICVARELMASFRGLNYSRFFGVLNSRATYLQKCCVHGFLWGFRSRALRIIYHGMGPVQSTFPLQSLIEILAFDDLPEALHFCEVHGITVVNNEMVKTASPMEEDVKVEWMRSRVLIGPPQPSRKAVIMGDLTASTAVTQQRTAPDFKAKEHQENLRAQREHQERNRVEEERQKQLAIKQKEEALQLHLKKLELLCVEFGGKFSIKKKSLFLRAWRDFAKSLRNNRADEKRRKQLQNAQRKFSEQKAYLTALSKVARLFLTHIWLNRWRSRTWNRQRADMIASLFRKHIWFRKWNREGARIRQFKRLARSRPITPVAHPIRRALPPPEQKPSFMQLLVERVNSDRNRPRSNVRLRVAVSVPTLRYSDAVQNRPYADFKICNAALKLLSLDDKPSFDMKCPLYGAFNLELRLIRTVGKFSEQPIQGILFFASYQDISQPLTNFELLRLRALNELEPNVPVLVLYSGNSPDPTFEEIFRSKLPPLFEERLSFVHVSSESTIANLLVESVQWFLLNKIHESTSSFVSLENVIQLRSKEIVSLQIHPNAMISVFNKALFDIAQSIWTQGIPDSGSEQLQESKSIIKSHILPEIELPSESIEDHIGFLTTYVRDNFQGIVASQPVVSRMQQAFVEGADVAGLVVVIVNSRIDSLLLKLFSRGLQLLLCRNVPPLSIEKMTSMPLLPVSNDISERGVRSPTQAKKRTRDASSGPSIRELKRKLLGTDRASFTHKIDELLAKICR